MSSSAKAGQCPRLIVALGGSAGALAPFQHFFQKIPPLTGASFVVLQHMDPRQKSLLPELLAGVSQIPVLSAEHGKKLEPDHVYVVPPGAGAQLKDGCFQLSPIEDLPNPRRPIDFFFCSLAETLGHCAIGVVLSGTGTDGAEGLFAIREAGGLTYVQNPAESKFGGMPQAAIDADGVDRVLGVEQIARSLGIQARVLLDSIGEDSPRVSEVTDASTLNEICRLLAEQTGHDFASYKKSTLARRIERRIHARHSRSLSEYVTLLEGDTIEARALLKDLLISVTEFFRDSEAFQALKDQVLPRIFQRAHQTGAVRVWVPACATGEEAYSLAILLKNFQKEHQNPVPIQIFATDIDRPALEIARQGKYPETIAQHVSPKDLATYFSRQGSYHQVTEELREVCIFSEHSLIKNAPFSRIDLISCRNLFIYWEPELQTKVLPVLHYALNPEGFLFLGAAESASGLPELFRTIDKKHRIFQRVSGVSHAQFPFSPHSIRMGAQSPVRAIRLYPGEERDFSRIISSTLLDSYAPPALIITEHGEIVFFSGRTGRYLQPATGAPSNNVFDVVRKTIRPELHALVHRAIKTGKEVLHPRMTIESEGLLHEFDLSVRPMPELGESVRLYMVVFQESSPARTKDQASQEEISLSQPDAVVQQLETELRETREHLQSTIEEVKSSNEELLSMNEELQSANEELQTSKEELQSANEELETVNAELSNKVEALDQANSDLQNFFQNTQVPTLFLDRRFRIQKFTPAANRVFRLIPGDVGRSIVDITSNLEDFDLPAEFTRVLETLVPSEREVRSKDGRQDFIMRVGPYRTVSDLINGIVVTFADVTELKRAQEFQGQLAAIVESSNDAIIGRDLQGRITSWNVGAERLLDYKATEVIGRSLDSFIPQERKEEFARIYERVEHGLSVSSLNTERLRKDGVLVSVSMSASPIRGSAGKIKGVSVILRDVTEQRRTEEARARLAKIVESSEDAIISKDLNAIVTSWNKGAERLLGYTAQEMVGTPIFRIVPPDHPEDVMKILSAVSRGEKIQHFETVRVHKDGHRIHVSLSVSPIRDSAGKIIGASKIARDITDRKLAEESLQRSLRLRDEFISIASHELKTPLTSMKLQAEITKRKMARLDPEIFAPDRVAKMIHQTDRQLDRLNRLVDDMLDISRITSGRLQLHCERVNLSSLVQESLEQFNELITASGCQVTTELEAEVNGKWDRARIEQVVVNLLTNATRYAKGKPITVRARMDSKFAVLEVKDEGIGIAREDQQRIFERFERASDISQGGFGLGLYIVREIIRAHGGTISVESDLGKGAKFRVLLPNGEEASDAGG